MPTAVVRYTGTVAARTAEWTGLAPDALKRRASAAARDRDAEALWGCTEAFLTLMGKQGARLSPHTAQAYRRGVAVLVEAWRGENLLRPSANAGVRFVRDLEWTPLAPSTVAVRLAAARALYGALRWTGATTADPFPRGVAGVRPAPDPTPPWEKRPPYPTAAIEAMLAACRTDSDRLLVLFGAHGGLRISETLAVEWAALDLEAGTLRVVGKGRKPRTVVLSSTLRQLLAAAPRTGERLFSFGSPTQGRRRIAALCDRAGVPYQAFHSLRHACGARLYAELPDLDAVARHLGHASMETARIYAKFSDERLTGSVGQW